MEKNFCFAVGMEWVNKKELQVNPFHPTGPFLAPNLSI